MLSVVTTFADLPVGRRFRFDHDDELYVKTGPTAYGSIETGESFDLAHRGGASKSVLIPRAA